MIGYGYDRFLRALYSRPQENAVELSGIPPLHLVGSKGKPLKNYRIYGNTQRAITIDGVKYPVPDDVTLLDSVTTDGNVKIDTTVVPTATMEFELEASYPSVGSTTVGNIIFGTRTNGRGLMVSNYRTSAVINPSETINGYCRIGATNASGTIALPITANEFFNLKVDAAGFVYLNGAKLFSSALTRTAPPSVALGIFHANISGTGVAEDVAMSGTKFRKLILTDNGVAVAAYHSATKNNVVGIYDFVSKSFIAPTSGTLTAGKTTRTVTIGGESIEVPLCEYESVGERTVNLFDDANVEWIDGKYINDRGTITSDAGSSYTDTYIPIEPDTTYTLSGFSDEVGSGSLRVHFYDSDKEWLKLGGKTNLSNEKITFTTTNATKYIRFSGKAFVDVMLVKGSVVPSSYIPYGYRVPIRIETGNLINLTAVTDGYYYNDSGVYTQTTDARLTDWIKADAGDVLTLTCTRTGTPRLRMCFFDADKNYISQENTNASETLTATAPANTAYVRMSANYQGSLCIDWNTATLIKAAPTVTVYLSAPLEKVTDADYIDFTRQIWHREIGVKVFDGTEDWAYDSAYMRFYVSLSDIVTVSPPRTVPGICSHYKLISDSRSISDVTVGQCYFGPMGQKGNCLIIHNGTSDLTYFKAWLAAQYANGTPVTVWYPLATPVEESITLPSISAIAGGCYADVQTAIKPSNLQIKYLK